MKNKVDIRNQHNFPMLIHVSYVEIPIEKITLESGRGQSWPPSKFFINHIDLIYRIKAFGKMFKTSGQHSPGWPKLQLSQTGAWGKSKSLKSPGFPPQIPGNL